MTLLQVESQRTEGLWGLHPLAPPTLPTPYVEWSGPYRWAEGAP